MKNKTKSHMHFCRKCEKPYPHKFEGCTNPVERVCDQCAYLTVPVPIKSEQRICFGISWFWTEIDADLYENEVIRTNRTYNGGYFHGMSCGRATGFDFEDPTLGKLYAVTD